MPVSVGQSFDLAKSPTEGRAAKMEEGGIGKAMSTNTTAR